MQVNQGGDAFPKRIKAINPEWEEESPDKCRRQGIFKYNNVDLPGMSVRTLAAIEVLKGFVSNSDCMDDNFMKEIADGQRGGAPAVKASIALADKMIQELGL